MIVHVLVALPQHLGHAVGLVKPVIPVDVKDPVGQGLVGNANSPRLGKAAAVLAKRIVDHVKHVVHHLGRELALARRWRWEGRGTRQRREGAVRIQYAVHQALGVLQDGAQRAHGHRGGGGCVVVGRVAIVRQPHELGGVGGRRVKDGVQRRQLAAGAGRRPHLHLGLGRHARARLLRPRRHRRSRLGGALLGPEQARHNCRRVEAHARQVIVELPPRHLVLVQDVVNHRLDDAHRGGGIVRAVAALGLAVQFGGQDVGGNERREGQLMVVLARLVQVAQRARHALVRRLLHHVDAKARVALLFLGLLVHAAADLVQVLLHRLPVLEAASLSRLHRGRRWRQKKVPTVAGAVAHAIPAAVLILGKVGPHQRRLRARARIGAAPLAQGLKLVVRKGGIVLRRCLRRLRLLLQTARRGRRQRRRRRWPRAGHHRAVNVAVFGRVSRRFAQV